MKESVMTFLVRYGAEGETPVAWMTMHESDTLERLEDPVDRHGIDGATLGLDPTLDIRRGSGMFQRL